MLVYDLRISHIIIPMLVRMSGNDFVKRQLSEVKVATLQVFKYTYTDSSSIMLAPSSLYIFIQIRFLEL